MITECQKSILVHGFLKRVDIHRNKQKIFGAQFNMLFVNKSRPLITKAKTRYIEITHANLDLFTEQFDTLGKMERDISGN